MMTQCNVSVDVLSVAVVGNVYAALPVRCADASQWNGAIRLVCC